MFYDKWDALAFVVCFIVGVVLARVHFRRRMALLREIEASTQRIYDAARTFHAGKP